MTTDELDLWPDWIETEARRIIIRRRIRRGVLALAWYVRWVIVSLLITDVL